MPGHHASLVCLALIASCIGCGVHTSIGRPHRPSLTACLATPCRDAPPPFFDRLDEGFPAQHTGTAYLDDLARERDGGACVRDQVVFERLVRRRERGARREHVAEQRSALGRSADLFLDNLFGARRRSTPRGWIGSEGGIGQGSGETHLQGTVRIDAGPRRFAIGMLRDIAENKRRSAAFLPWTFARACVPTPKSATSRCSISALSRRRRRHVYCVSMDVKGPQNDRLSAHRYPRNRHAVGDAEMEPI